MARKPPPRRPAGPRTEWGGVAAWYDQLVGEGGSEYQRQVVLPGVLRLLEAKAGQRVLDVACGQGVLSRLLHAQDVAAVGVDAAGELLAAARRRSEGGIEYHQADARALSEHPALARAAGTFHAAACVLAIQNIQPIAPVFEGVAKALAAGGRFVLAMMHPCFRGPKASAWGWDEDAGVQYRRVDRYLLPRKEPIQTHPGSDPSRYTWSFHRPLGAYVQALGKAGLLIDALEEWPSHKHSTSGPRAAAENRARREIPMFLAVRAVKR